MPQGPAVSGRPPTARGKRRGGKGEVDEGPVEAYSGRYFTRRLQVAGKDLIVAEAPNPGSTGSEVWRVAGHLVW